MTPLSAARKLTAMAIELGRHPAEVRYGVRWLKSMLPGHSPLTDAVPWITFRAFDWLEEYLQPHMTVFEYGAGGSTLFFAAKARQVISVEHDKGFFEIVKSLLAERNINNCELVLHEAKPCTDESQPFASEQKRYQGMCFESYVKEIDKHADESFDVVLVDGRARVACVHRAIRKIKAGGIIVLDNTERLSYRSAYRALEDSSRIDFPGLSPWNMKASQTTIWRMRTLPIK